MKDLVCSLIRIKPNERPTAKEALQHKWFNKKFGGDDEQKLGSAIQKLQERKNLKLTNPEMFNSKEGISMTQLTKEILRYGL